MGNGLEAARAFIQVLVRSVRRRRGAKRYFALIATLKDSGSMPEFGDEFAAALESTWNRLGDDRGPLVTKIHAYVLTRAILGVLCDAALSDSRFLKEAEIEDALFRIVVALSRSESCGALPVRNPG